MSHIVIDCVSKRFGAAQVLQDCQLEIAEGTVLTLLGPSGCGKTTLLRVIAGFVAPDAGRIVIAGRDISNDPPNRRKVGYVFQNYALFPHMTVANNIAYGLKIRRLPGEEIRRRVEATLDLVALSAFAGRFPAQLSGGQQQRVAIARSLVLEPSVLLLDEPFNALDAQLRLSMQVELRKLIERVGITSIFVTHDQMEAMTLSDSVAVMRAGRIEQVGPPLEIYDSPASEYVANFIGRANLVRDGATTLIVRPENIEITTDGEGWPGVVDFATALGPTVEYEIECGWAEKLRAIVPRTFGSGIIPTGTQVFARIVDRRAVVVINSHAH